MALMFNLIILTTFAEYQDTNSRVNHRYSWNFLLNERKSRLRVAEAVAGRARGVGAKLANAVSTKDIDVRMNAELVIDRPVDATI